MSYMKNKIIELCEMYEQGFSEYKISNMTGIPVEEVIVILTKSGMYYDDSEYDDSMDGDHASALASAGWGVDEDYVWENDYYD